MKVIMMTELKLPWDGMSESSKRRVEIITNHNTNHRPSNDYKNRLSRERLVFEIK